MLNISSKLFSLPLCSSHIILPRPTLPSYAQPRLALPSHTLPSPAKPRHARQLLYTPVQNRSSQTKMANLNCGVPRQLLTFCKEQFQLDDFLETGTFQGDSTAFAATLFDYVLSIELDDNNWAAAVNRFKGQEGKVDLWHGDSAELMPGALRQLGGRAFIWLDAHCVAGQFGNEDSCPLMEELAAINHAVHDEHIIVIDDAHCFQPPLPQYLTPEAWPTLEDIMTKAAVRGYALQVVFDLIILAPPNDMRLISKFLAALPVGPRGPLERLVRVKSEAINAPLKSGPIPAVFPAFTGITYTDYGWMLIHRFDQNQTASLVHARKSRDFQDIDRLAVHLKAGGYGSVFVDIGANMGAYSFGLRRYCSTVHAFEPQRIIYNMMCGSVALNGWFNVFCHNVALGRSTGMIEVPQFDYNKTLSFGSIEFGDKQIEPLAQERKYNPLRTEFVPLRMLDEYNLQRIDVMKIDVEGMELDVLTGASRTITRCRPIMLVEHGKSNKDVLRTVLESMGYVVEESGTFDFFCTPIP